MDQEPGGQTLNPLSAVQMSTKTKVRYLGSLKCYHSHNSSFTRLTVIYQALTMCQEQGSASAYKE